MNKRGFMFTFISVTLVSVILLAFLIQYTSRTKAEIERTNTEVETMNSFVKSLNSDYLPRALQISGNQAILALLNYTGNEEEYIDQDWNIQHAVINAMVDGEYENGLGQGSSGSFLELMHSDGLSYKLNDTLEEIKNLGNATGMTIIIDNVQDNNIRSRMEVSQDNPWYINLSMTISYSISNKKQDASWSYEDKKIKTSIPIFNNFIDPIYMIADGPGGEKGVLLTINKTIYDLPGEINPHVENTNFLACNLTPSFLNRMQRITTASPQGIESMVDVKSSQQSAIDYQYLHISEPEGALVQIWYSGYFIDSSHSDCYDLRDE